MSLAKMYFIAIAAPESINEQVLEWKHYMRQHYSCSVALRSPAHITLIPPFWMDETLENELVSDVTQFSSAQTVFDICLRNFDAFKPRVIFVAVEKNNSLFQLKLSLEEYLLELQKYPVKKESRPFHPHLTIANRDLRKKDFAPAFEHFGKIKYHACFEVRDMVLFRHDGIRWNIIMRWPFNIETNIY